MTSIPDTQNVPPVNGADKSDWPTIGCRIRPSDMFFVDEAVAELKQQTRRMGYKRSDFIIEAVIQKAMEVLGRKNDDETQPAA